MPLGTDAPNLGVPLMLVHPNLLVSSYLGKPLGAFTCPRCPLSQLGCQRNPKFHLIEDLGEGLHAHLVEDFISAPQEVSETTATKSLGENFVYECLGEVR
jgi:hypothetical protein